MNKRFTRKNLQRRKKKTSADQKSYYGKIQKKHDKPYAFLIPINYPNSRDFFIPPHQAKKLRHQSLVLFTPPPSISSPPKIIQIIFEPPNPSPNTLAQRDYSAHPKPQDDIALTIQEFNLREGFSNNLHREEDKNYQNYKNELEKLPQNRRKDLRNLPFVTIDGEDAKDFDDAVYVEQSRNIFTLYVAISDVSFYVSPHSDIDREARLRGTSVYLPGKALPMLPETLSSDLASLNPYEDKLTLTCTIQFSRTGDCIRSSFHPSIIQTKARLTYQEVDNFFHKKDSHPLSEDVKQSLHAMRRLTHLLLKKRKQRMVLDFNLQELEYFLDKDGMPYDIRPKAHMESHRIIEEFMIQANIEAAKILKKNNIPSLFRIHPAPDALKQEELNAYLLAHNIQPLKDFTIQSLFHLLESTKTHPLHDFIHKAILRSQSQARYDANGAIGHYGLGLKDYTHFTSPIRRYPDVIVHRGIKKYMSRQYQNTKQEKIDKEEDLNLLGIETSFHERIAMDAERFIQRRKQCWFMTRHIGKSFTAQITDRVDTGLMASIHPFYISGFIDNNNVEKKKSSFSRQTLTLGQMISVTVQEVSLSQHKIYLEVACL